mgnify:CR=1 FL=1
MVRPWKNGAWRDIGTIPWEDAALGAIGARPYKDSLAQTAKLNNLSVFKYLQAVLLYMPDYVHEPEGIEELMPWSDKMKKLCAIDTRQLSKTRMEIQRSHGSKLARSANTERLRNKK